MFDKQEYNRVYSREYYVKNKESRSQKAKEKRFANKQRALDYLGRVCTDCGNEFHHVAMDFHHRDPSQKDIALGYLWNWKWSSRHEEELDKCVLLCANCHRIRHHAEEYVD